MLCNYFIVFSFKTLSDRVAALPEQNLFPYFKWHSVCLENWFVLRCLFWRFRNQRKLVAIFDLFKVW